MHIYGGGYRGNTGQLDKDLIVRDIGQLIKGGDISLVSRRGESRLSGIGPGVSIAPLLQDTVGLL